MLHGNKDANTCWLQRPTQAPLGPLEGTIPWILKQPLAQCLHHPAHLSGCNQYSKRLCAHGQLSPSGQTFFCRGQVQGIHVGVRISKTAKSVTGGVTKKSAFCSGSLPCLPHEHRGSAWRHALRGAFVCASPRDGQRGTLSHHEALSLGILESAEDSTHSMLS